MSAKFKGPSFQPHIKLWSFKSPIVPNSEQEQNMYKSLAAMAEKPESQAVKRELSFGPVQTFKSWDQNVISTPSNPETSEVLGALNLITQTWFPQHSLEFLPSEEPDFDEPSKLPHLSYLYGNLDEDVRTKAIEYVHNNFPSIAKGIRFKGMYLTFMRVAGGKKGVWDEGLASVETWTEVARVPLEKQTNPGAMPLHAMAQKLSLEPTSDDESVTSHQSQISDESGGGCLPA